MERINTVFIIDTYNKFCGDKIIATFSVNGRWFAIKEVSLEWGIPQLNSIEEEAELPYFKLYSTSDEAKKYIRKLKRLEGTRF